MTDELREQIAKERQANLSCISMTISSHVPSKWRFVDLETGDIWLWDKDRGKFTGAEITDLYPLIESNFPQLGYVKLPPDSAILEGISNLKNLGHDD